MKYNNLFELSSTFETASGGGTLSYPNLSLIEESGEICKQNSRHIKFILATSNNVELTCKEGMTFANYINSIYNWQNYNKGGFMRISSNDIWVRHTDTDESIYELIASLSDIIENNKTYYGSAGFN